LDNFTIQQLLSEGNERPLNFRQSFFKYIVSAWYWYLICLSTALAAAWVYLRYTERQYQAKCTIRLKTPEASGIERIPESFLFGEMGTLGAANNIENEMQTLRSRSLMRSVVDRLGLAVKYEEHGRLQLGEKYSDSAVLLDSFVLASNLSNFSFQVEATELHVKILKGEAILAETAFGEWVQTRYGGFRFVRNKEAKISGNTLTISILKPEDVARAYAGRMIAKRVGDYSSILELSIKDPVPDKAADILNSLTETYNENSIRDKNQVWQNTYDFINDRLKFLTAELSDAEGAVERFKSNNAVSADIMSNISDVLAAYRTNDDELSRLELQQTFLGSLEEGLNRPVTDLLPANFVVENTELSTQTLRFNNLVLERKRLLSTVRAEHISIKNVDSQIQDMRSVLAETLRNVRANLQKSIAAIKTKNTEIQRGLRNLPSIERQLVDITRQKNIKENLYLFLLQKREEAALSMAVALADSKVIDPAEPSRQPVEPNPNLIYAFAILLGLAIPISVIVIKSLLSDTIETVEDVTSKTSAPFLGFIALSKSAERVVVNAKSRTAVAEMFRLLRTNLQFLRINESNHTIAITSASSGEGKSFLTLNLGIALALSGKKTIIIGCDLRKPKLSGYVGLQSSRKGLSHYLIGDALPEELLQPSGQNPALYIIDSGPIPPNPAELLLQPRLAELFDYLRVHFEYILVDTPPVGLVSDTLMVGKFADSTIFLVRASQTKKIVAEFIEDLYQHKKLPNLSIVLNGVQEKSKNGYGYGYGYGYNSYYHEEEGVKKWWQKILPNWKKKQK
jgi:capsular exopolysaccharide synthesis family protein